MNKFDEYVKNYDMTEPHIDYKYHHSYRVMDDMVLLAKNMSLPKEDIQLASCIGLLHDIGRFEQYKRYKSFSDFNLDHGDFASEEIIKINILPSFGIKKEDYEVVVKAIKNHNKFKIDPKLSTRELLFAKMIRDADKLDILFALGDEKLNKIIREDDSKVSKEISDSFFKGEMVERKTDDNLSDNLVTMFGFVFDINFDITLDIIKSNKYYDKIYTRIKNKAKFKPYIDKVNAYLDERID